MLLCTGTLLRSLHQAQRCQVPSALWARALPSSGGIPRAAGERQGASRWIRQQTDVPSLPTKVRQNTVFQSTSALWLKMFEWIIYGYFKGLYFPLKRLKPPMSIDPSFMFLIHLFAYKMLGDIFYCFLSITLAHHKLCGKKQQFLACEKLNLTIFWHLWLVKVLNRSDLPEYELQNSHINLCHPHIWIFTQKSNS